MKQKDIICLSMLNLDTLLDYPNKPKGSNLYKDQMISALPWEQI